MRVPRSRAGCQGSSGLVGRRRMKGNLDRDLAWDFVEVVVWESELVRKGIRMQVVGPKDG